MAHSKQARKRRRQAERRTFVNRNRRSRVRTFVRRVEDALAAGDSDAAAALYTTKTCLLVSHPISGFPPPPPPHPTREVHFKKH